MSKESSKDVISISQKSIMFIHIGKTGGGSITQTYQCPQVHKQKIRYRPGIHYFTWVRHPMTRFVSAFNMAFDLIHDECTIPVNEITIDNCPYPISMRQKVTTGHAFPVEYEEQIVQFGTANGLAEALSSPDPVLRGKAVALMQSHHGHIHQGIAWYLNNGEFVRQYRDQILMVGRVEYMEQDMQRLNTLLGVCPTVKKIHENTSGTSKYLSELAVRNLLEFFESTEYATLRVLVEQGLLDERTYQAYRRDPIRRTQK